MTKLPRISEGVIEDPEGARTNHQPFSEILMELGKTQGPLYRHYLKKYDDARQKGISPEETGLRLLHDSLSFFEAELSRIDNAKSFRTLIGNQSNWDADPTIMDKTDQRIMLEPPATA